MFFACDKVSSMIVSKKRPFTIYKNKTVKKNTILDLIYAHESEYNFLLKRLKEETQDDRDFLNDIQRIRTSVGICGTMRIIEAVKGLVQYVEHETVS